MNLLYSIYNSTTSSILNSLTWFKVFFRINTWLNLIFKSKIAYIYLPIA
nr:MAG TPA: hypothetical protein [Crassvirales sp.]